MDASDWAAWYAAGVSTLTALWEIVLHLRKGPRLRIKGRIKPPGGVPRHDRAMILFDVWNRGDSPTTIEAISASQDGRRFLTCVAYSVVAGQPVIQCPVKIGSEEHIVFTLSCSDDEVRSGRLIQPGRPLAPERPVVVFVQTSSSEKEIVVKVPAEAPLDGRPWNLNLPWNRLRNRVR